MGMEDYEAENAVIEAYRDSEEFKTKVKEAKELMRGVRAKLRSKGPSLPPVSKYAV